MNLSKLRDLLRKEQFAKPQVVKTVSSVLAKQPIKLPHSCGHCGGNQISRFRDTDIYRNRCILQVRCLYCKAIAVFEFDEEVFERTREYADLPMVPE